MNIDEILNNTRNGVSYVNPNPSKSKKHPSSKRLIVNDPEKVAELSAGYASTIQNSGLRQSTDLSYLGDKAKELEHYGITPNANIDDVSKTLAESQSNLRKLGSAVSQAVVSEIGLGTARGAADLFDFIGNTIVGNTFTGDNDYTNPVSEKIQEWQDYFNTEVAPIYANPDVDVFNGGLTDFGWWASNMPSIMSSVTLLIPSTAATKGLQWLAKISAASKLGTATRNGIKALVGIDKALAKEGGTLNKFQQGVKTVLDAPINGVGAKTGKFMETGLNAALSRTMENYQEAQGVYSDMYNNAKETLDNMTPQQFTEFINKNQDLYDEAGGDNASKDDIAKLIAQKSANRDFLYNYVNIGSDILQLYGLRGMWKGIKNGVSSSTLTTAARQARATLGKTPEEIVEMEAKRGFLSKAGNKILGKLKDEKTIVAGEMSEGVEEAVNYIAQMEGTHLGNVYLGLESDSNFDDRLQKYMQSGGLWDSAFWGMMGGVVFHHLGSGFNRISNTLKERADSKTNEQTGESKSKPKFGLSETSEIKARKANIESWNNSIENYWNQMNQIKDGKNPFSLDKANDKLENQYDSEAAAQRAYDELITNMTLNAAHNGNFDLLRSYIGSDEIRKAMVDKGVTNEKDSKVDQQKALDKMDEVISSYDTELKKLINVSEAVRVTKKQDDILPVEFLQSIATDNVLYKQRSAKIDEQIQELDKQIDNAFNNADIKAKLGEDYTPQQYQTAASNALLTKELQTLQAERSRLLDNKEKMNSISTKVALDNINKLMNKYQDMLDTNALRYSLHEALQSSYDEHGNVKSFANQASITLANLLNGQSNSGVELDDVNIINGLKKFAEKYQVSSRIAEFENPTDVVGQVRESGKQLKAINEKLSSTDGIGVDGNNGNLTALLVNKTALQLRQAYNESKIISNADELSKEVSFLNNTINEGRKKAIDSAYNTITSLSDKYEKDKFAQNISNAIGVYYNGRQEDIDDVLSFMNETDRNAFTDALDVLHLTSGVNYRLGEQLQGFLNMRQAIFDSQDRNASHNINNEDDSNNGAEPESTTDDSSASQTTSNKPLQDAQTEQPINRPGPTPEADTAQGNTPEGNLSPENGSQNPQNEVGQRVAQFLSDGKGISPKPQFDDTGDITGNEIVLNKDATDEDKKAFMGNADLFDNPELASESNVTVETNPSYNIDDSGNPINVKPGHLVVKGNENKTNKNEDKERSPFIPSTGRLEQTATTKSADTNSGDMIDLITKEFMVIIKPAVSEVKSGKATVDDIVQRLRQKGEELGADKNLIDSRVNFCKIALTSQLGTKFASSVGEVMLASGVSEYKPSFTFGQDYKDAAAKMLKIYASEVKLRQHNGKWYGNLEDLLRYVNESSADKSTAGFIYHSLKEYLKTADGKKEFVMLDADSVDDADFMTNVNKPASERRAEAIAAGTLKRVNIQNINEVVDSDKIDETKEELDKLKEGDKLTLKKGTKVDKRTNVLLVQHNGVTVGWMGIPSVDKFTGNYIQVNDGIKFEIGSSAEQDGKVKDWLLSIADPKDEDSKKLNDIIFKVAFENKRTPEDVEKFKNNPRVQEAIKVGYIVINKEKGFTEAKALNGLAKLWKYNTSISNYYNPIPYSINLFFDNLRNSYKTTLGLLDSNQELTVSKISKGKLLRLAPHGTPGEAFRVAQPASKAISPKSDARIALARNMSQIEVSGKETNENLGFNMNQTLIAIDNGNGTVDYANAYPVNWGVTTYEENGNPVTMQNSKVLKDMTAAIEGQIKDRLHNLHNGDSLTNWTEFKEFLNTLLDYNNNSTLFKTHGVFHFRNGLDFINISPTQSIKLYRCDTKGTGAPTKLVFMENKREVRSYDLVSEADAAANALVDTLRKFATINFAHEVLTSDNNKALPLKGFISRTADGKVQIEIPAYNGKNGFSHIEESYNDFMIKNDLLRVDLAQVDGSNYSRFSDNMAANSTLEFTVGEEKADTSNNKSLEMPDRRDKVGATKQDKVKSIIESDSETKGMDIVKAILPKDSVNLLNTIKDKDELLPKSITFADDKIKAFQEEEDNENITAMYSNGNIIVGNDFLKENSGRQVRILIHENLHARLYNLGATRHKKFLNNMTEIYDDFSREIAQDITDAENGNFDAIRNRRDLSDAFSDDSIKTWIGNINKFLFKEYVDKGQNDRAKEEFIVESLTNTALIEYLNKVKVDDVGSSSTDKNLWQRIMDFIDKLFGLDAVEGSLREKEYNAFAKALSYNTNDNTQQQAETNSDIDEETETNNEEEVNEENNENEEDSYGKDRELSDDIDETSSIDDDDFDIDELSSRPEYPSIYSSISSLPMEQHSQFASLLEAGDVSISCK